MYVRDAEVEAQRYVVWQSDLGFDLHKSDGVCRKFVAFNFVFLFVDISDDLLAIVPSNKPNRPCLIRSRFQAVLFWIKRTNHASDTNVLADVLLREQGAWNPLFK